MIAPLDPMQSGAGTETADHRVQEVGPREGIPRSLDEQHGHGDLGEVPVPELVRLPRRMERVGEENEPVRGRPRGHDLGGDPAPHGAAAVNEARRREDVPDVLGDGPGRRFEQGGRIGPSLASLGVEEVVEHDAAAGARERIGQADEGGVASVPSRSVSQDECCRALPVNGSAHLAAGRPDPDLVHGPSIAATSVAPGGTLQSEPERASRVYEAWYGLVEKPFNLTPDPKYLYLSRRHAEAFAHLEFGQRERGGFILLTGEVGTGKTTLARYFLGKLPDNTATAVVVYPALTAAELLRSILEDLHVPTESASLKDLVDALHRFLLEARAQGRDVILLIDEAQALSTEVLEQVRLISNLETDTEKLIQIVLLGQSELREHLSRRNLRQLAQRVTARYHLDGLSRTETEEYIRHRLHVAGGDGKVRLTLAALNGVHELSGGIPRIINLVCDRSLLAGYVAGTRTITAEMVRRAASEVRGEEEQKRWKPRPVALVGSGMVVAAALALALLLPRTLQAPTAPPPPPPTAPPATLAAPPTPTPPPPFSERLEAAVQDSDRLGSFRHAVARLEGLWDRPRLQRTSLRTQPRPGPQPGPSRGARDVPPGTEGHLLPRPRRPRRADGRRHPRRSRPLQGLRGPARPALDARGDLSLARRQSPRGRPAEGRSVGARLAGPSRIYARAEPGPRPRGVPARLAAHRRRGRGHAHPDDALQPRVRSPAAAQERGFAVLSLIFEALKKLEREKEAPERGVVIVGPGAWGEREPRSSTRTAAALGLVLLGLGLAAFALRARTGPPPSTLPEASTPPEAQAAREEAAIPVEAPLVAPSSREIPPPPPRLVVPTPTLPRAAAAPETIELTPPPDPVVPREPQFRLNAISTREGRPVALLNDRLVREGDVIEGMRVLHIGDDYVEIEVKGERRTIRF